MTEGRRREVRFRGREIIFSAADELVYAELLVRAFPDVRFLDLPDVLPRGEKPPEATVRSLAECHGRETLIVFDPAWKPTWECDPGPRNWDRWYIKGLTCPNGEFGRFYRVKPSKRGEARPENERIESIGADKIYFRIAPNDKDQEAVARKALGLIGKMASRANMRNLRMPQMEDIGKPRMIEYWVGNDARRWCLEKPNRTLGGTWNYKRGGWAMRPAEPIDKDGGNGTEGETSIP